MDDKDSRDFLIRAFKASRRLTPYEDGDTICFTHFMDPGHEDYKVSNDFDTQVRYWQMRRDGQTHKFAEMMATRSFPGIRTDSTFNEGRVNGNQFEKTPWLGDFYKHESERRGVSVTGKFYCNQLARFPGDPEAWVSGRGDVERVCRERGYGCEGDVTVEKSERPPITDVDIDPDLVESEVQSILKENPELAHEGLTERVAELRSGKIDPNPLRVQDPPPEGSDLIGF